MVGTKVVLRIGFMADSATKPINKTTLVGKVEKILKDSLHLFQSPSPSVKIQIIGRKVCLRGKL